MRLDDNAWEAGFAAYYSGLYKDENPFPEDSPEYTDWNAGWDEAYLTGNDD